MLHVVYEDRSLLVINKATGVLSQPGKTRDGSVVTEVRTTYVDARGPLLVHRLDMDTSGIILIGKTRAAHRHLQQQFEHRQVRKRYTALLDAWPNSVGGLIELPLSKDWENRPKQRVDFTDGKSAITAWRLAQESLRCLGVLRLNVKPESTCSAQPCRVHLYPKTGRTHQLRVHVAQALGCPIVGDRLYGTPATRLMLHADRLSFTHPETGAWLSVAVPASF